MRRQRRASARNSAWQRSRDWRLTATSARCIPTRGTLPASVFSIATGAHPRRIGFPGEDDFRGRGVAYCATCDGEFFAGKPVFVVGGGFAAAEESVFLTRYASHVTVLIRGRGLHLRGGCRTTCPRASRDYRADAHRGGVGHGGQSPARPALPQYRDRRRLFLPRRKASACSSLPGTSRDRACPGVGGHRPAGLYPDG